ncbi:DUF364 domain-containing protein [Aminithiophilus ramosus]|uniref:DUF364 domain-containing protein n=2 Tax=Synergistales TaxID=649776 RepID=A0A9Q7APD7_9BACT|nr:DUF364 domain-containing protein [Aminithiophilus ramosus]QVL35554.1 DUF364 domain-containing protein [Synergistota bacterium]
MDRSERQGDTVNFEPGSILKETAEKFQALIGPDFDTLTLERTVFGLFFTGVKLSDGQGGISFTPVKAIPEAVCCPTSARAMPLSGRLKGMSVTKVLQEMWEADSPLKKALGIATLNALSAICEKGLEGKGYRLEIGNDALDSIEIADDDKVVVVGALVPMLKKLKIRGKPFTVLELDPRTLKKDEMPFFAPSEEAPLHVPGADLLVMTGTTLVNDTLEGLLSLAKPGARVVVVGPTASQYPEEFFRRGVTCLGGIKVTKADELLDILSEGGSGYHFFGRYAERTTLTKPSPR